MDDVLERANNFASELSEADRQRRVLDLGALHLIHALAAEVRALRAKLQHSEGMQSGALRLKRIRDLRLKAIRDTVSQNKDDDLVRREVEWFLDCDGSELDGFAALSASGGEDRSDGV